MFNVCKLLQSLKSWALTFQPGDDGRKEVGIKTHVKFNNFESADMALSLKLPDNTYELKGFFLSFSFLVEFYKSKVLKIVKNNIVTSMKKLMYYKILKLGINISINYLQV